MDRKILYNLSALTSSDIPQWDILGFFRKKDGSVWVEFSYFGKVRRKKCYNIGALYKGQFPEFNDRYGVVLSMSQVQEYGFNPGTYDGLRSFDVTPMPNDGTSVPLPPIIDI